VKGPKGGAVEADAVGNPRRPDDQQAEILTAVDRRGTLLVPYRFGTIEWARFVFANRSVEDPFSSSRPAERGIVKVAGEIHVPEGHERVALYVLEHLFLIGFLTSIKSQPFCWLLPGASKLRWPDFLVQARDGRLYLIEVKAHRYITREIEERFERTRRTCAQYGVTLLVWSEQTFLTRPIRNLFTALRRARSTEIDPDVIDELVACVQLAGGQVVLGGLLDQGQEPATVLKAVRLNRLHISLSETLHVNSSVSLHPIDDPQVFILDRGYHASSWWRAMQDRRNRGIEDHAFSDRNGG
jgi:hypothetical protein